MSVFVTGMHRSGTSMLARLLRSLGFYLGEPEDLMLPKPDNPGGFWERLDVMRINNQLLASAQSSWDWPQPLDTDFWHKGYASYHATLVHDAQQLLRTLDSRAPWAIKDPRLCLTLPFWQPLLPSVRLIICVRNPFEVAQSLCQRHHLTENFGIQLWLTYTESLLRMTRPEQRLVLHYQDLLDAPQPQIRRLTAWLEISSSQDAMQDALAVINPVARHQRVTDWVKRLERPGFAKLKQYYKQLLSEAEQGCGTESSTLPKRQLGHLGSPCSTPVIGSEMLDTGPLVLPVNSVPVDEDGAAAGNTHGKNADVSGPRPSKPKPIPGAWQDPIANRKVILHYHLFKNAGTSLDHILKQNFKTGWHTHEGSGRVWRTKDIAEYLEQHPGIIVLSSHNALLPPPVLPDTMVYPVLFIRHPIDRIRSIYEFERQQIANTEGARMAKETDMVGYIKWRLNRKGDRSIRNFQSCRLALAVPEMEGGKKLGERERAMKAIETLPFVGVVERFDESLVRLQEWLQPVFPHIDFKPTKANVTQKAEMTLEKRLEALKAEIGERVYGEVVEVNEVDLEVYKYLANLLVAMEPPRFIVSRTR